MNLDLKQFNFLSTLTAIVVLLYMFTATYAFAIEAITFLQFAGVVGPVSGTLLGYWIRDKQG